SGEIAGSPRFFFCSICRAKCIGSTEWSGGAIEMWTKKALARGWLMLLTLAPAVSLAAAQNGDVAAEASAAYDGKDWARAARLYEGLVKEHPEVPRLWFRLADSQQQLGQLDQALATMQNGLKAGAPPVFAEFLIGSIYAQK